MKIKLTILAAIAAVIGMTACVNEEGGNTPGKDQKSEIFVKISKTGETRVEAEKNNNAAIAIREGDMFFVKLDGTITRHIAIKASGATGDDQVDIATLRSGAEIKDVSTESKYCYILANTTNVTLPTITEGTTNISAVKVLTMAVADMKDTNGAVANVPLWGEGNITNPSGDKLITEVEVKAMGSRLQIGKFTGEGKIKSYKVTGIFVNNYFAQMPIGKTLVAANITDNKSVVARYVGGSTQYPATLPLYDYDLAGLGQFAGAQTLICTPKNAGSTFTNPVWAYNIFPNAGVPTATAATVPHIVIRFESVIIDDAPNPDITLPDPQFITIKGIKDSGAALASISGGYAYTFPDVKFDETNLTDVPEVDTINAEVEIDEIPWVDADFEPEI